MSEDSPDPDQVPIVPVLAPEEDIATNTNSEIPVNVEPQNQIDCYICGKNDGQVLTPCSCGNYRAVHFDCIRNSILANQSVICRSCQSPLEGICPIYAKKRISRFLWKYVSHLAYRLIVGPLFVMLLFRVIFINGKKKHTIVSKFWLLFFSYLVLSTICLGVYTLKGVVQIKKYNKTNSDIIDIELESYMESDPNATQEQ